MTIQSYPLWRKRWDSNPRALADYRISSAARYDHFDTLPDILLGAVGDSDNSIAQ